ncbi:MAG: hypothetical protein EBT72_08285, partial [Flavobacteriia bacterium]|nr:hypothetical protein [Flavobacteriia bacterium]
YGDGWQGSHLLFTVDGNQYYIGMPSFMDGEGYLQYESHNNTIIDYVGDTSSGTITVIVPETASEMSLEFIPGDWPEEIYWDVEIQRIGSTEPEYLASYESNYEQHLVPIRVIDQVYDSGSMLSNNNDNTQWIYFWDIPEDIELELYARVELLDDSNRVIEIYSESIYVDGIRPTIEAAFIDPSNQFVDVMFTEEVFSKTDPLTGLTSSSLTLSQLSGATVTATISYVEAIDITSAAMDFGSTSVRVYLELSNNLIGGELFSITAASSGSVVDYAGNAMTVSQTNNSFELNQPVSGPPSPINSEISLDLSGYIANGDITTTILIKAIDSLGQSFTQGG